MDFKLLGAGSPLVDYSLAVPEEFLQRFFPGGKGATFHVTPAERAAIMADFDGTGLRTPGGSAANTLRIFAKLGGNGAFFGKAGRDEDGDFFADALKKSGVDHTLLRYSDKFPTGYCLSLVTPDAERTMLSDLAASVQISADDWQNIDFGNYSLLLLEGYMINEAWLIPFLQTAHDAGCKIALDLNNFESVTRSRERFLTVISGYVDILLGNMEEFSRLFPGSSPDGIISKLQQSVALSICKAGSDGALIITADQLIRVEAEKDIAVKDTTGAGDFFAAGFFYGMSRGLPYHVCGKMGALCAAAIISVNGTLLSDNEFNILKNNIERL